MIQNNPRSTTPGSGSSDNSTALLTLALTIAIQGAAIGALLTYIVAEGAGRTVLEAVLVAGVGFIPLASLGITIARIALRR